MTEHKLVCGEAGNITITDDETFSKGFFSPDGDGEQLIKELKKVGRGDILIIRVGGKR